MLLLDTQLVLWWLGGDKRLPEQVVDRVRTPGADVFISFVSLWEMAIKKNIRASNGKMKLELPVRLEDVEQVVVAAGFQWLQLKISHIVEVGQLETCKDHKDPFDRLLVAQSRAESMEFLTTDNGLKFYGVTFYQPAQQW